MQQNEIKRLKILNIFSTSLPFSSKFQLTMTIPTQFKQNKMKKWFLQLQTSMLPFCNKLISFSPRFQLITTIPTHKLPRCLARGSMTKEEIELIDKEEPLEPTVDDMGRRGQILWIRGLTRLQHQVRMGWGQGTKPRIQA